MVQTRFFLAKIKRAPLRLVLGLAVDLFQVNIRILLGGFFFILKSKGRLYFFFVISLSLLGLYSLLHRLILKSWFFAAAIWKFRAGQRFKWPARIAHFPLKVGNPNLQVVLILIRYRLILCIQQWFYVILPWVNQVF